MFLRVKGRKKKKKKKTPSKLANQHWVIRYSVYIRAIIQQRISLTQFFYVGDHRVALFHVRGSKAVDREHDERRANKPGGKEKKKQKTKPHGRYLNRFFFPPTVKKNMVQIRHAF